MDVAAGAPNAAQEMALLNQALKMCQAAGSMPPPSSQQPPSEQPPNGLVVPENGSPDPNAGPPPNYGSPPYDGPPPNNNQGPPPSNAGGGGSIFPGVLQALQNLGQLFFQYCNGPGGGSQACSSLGWLDPSGGYNSYPYGSPYGNPSQYGPPPGAYGGGGGGGTTYQSSIPSYARPQSSTSRQPSGYYPQPWNNPQGYYQQPWNNNSRGGYYQQQQAPRPSYAQPYGGSRGGPGYGRQVYNAARKAFSVARKGYTAARAVSRGMGLLRYIR